MRKLFVIILLSWTSFFYGQDFKTKPTISINNPRVGEVIEINSGKIVLEKCFDLSTGNTYSEIPDLRLSVLTENDYVLEEQTIKEGSNLVFVSCRWSDAKKVKIEILGGWKLNRVPGATCSDQRSYVPLSSPKFEILPINGVYFRRTGDVISIPEVSGGVPDPNEEADMHFYVRHFGRFMHVNFRENFYYHWFKNNNMIGEPTSYPSQDIKCRNTDRIQVFIFDECRELIDVIDMIPERPEPPSLSLATNSCITGMINAKHKNFETIQWARDEDFNSIITDMVTIDGNLNYEITQPTTFYARTFFKGLWSSPNSITVTPFPSPTYSSVAGNNQSFCGNTAVFQVNGENFDLIEWFSGPEGFTSQLLSKTNPYNHNIANIPNGDNLKIYFRLRSKEGCYTQTNEVNYNKISNQGTVSTTSKLSYCVDSDVDISLSSTSSTSFQWFEDQTMNIPVNPSLLSDNGRRLNYTTTATNIGNKTYWYRGLNSAGCATPLYSLIVTVKQKPSNLIVTNQNAKVCKGKNIVFEVGADNALSYVFYSNNLGSIPITSNISNNTYTVNTTDKSSGNYSFWVKAISGEDCETELTQVNYTVLDLPTSLSVIGEKPNYCTLDTINVTPIATNASSYIWSYNNAFNNLVEASKIDSQGKLNYIPTTNESNNYWVKGVGINGCETTPIPVDINVYQKPIDVGITNNNTSVCFGQTISFAAFATYEDSFKFYSNASGTNQITSPQVQNNIVTFSSTNYTIGTNTFYFKAINNNGCETDLIKVTFSVLAQPTNLLVTGSTNYCTNDTVLITPSATDATSYIWAYDSNFNNIVEASKIDSQGKLNYLAETAIENQTYYVKANNSNVCQTTPIAFTFTVNDIPGPTSITGSTTYCLNENIRFSLINSNSQKFSWFSDSNGLNPISSQFLSNDGATIVMPATSTALKMLYYRTINSSGCMGVIEEKSYTVLAAPTNITVTNNSISYCSNDIIDIIAGANNATEFEWFIDSKATTLVDKAFLYGNLSERYRPVGLAPGNYSVWVRGKNIQGCFTEIIQVNFVVRIKPIIKNINTLGKTSIFKIGDEIILSIDGTNYDRYKILKNNTNFIPKNNSYLSGNITQFILTKNATLADEGVYKIVLSNGTCEEERDFPIIIIPQDEIITHDKSISITNDNGTSKIILKNHESIQFTSTIANLKNYTFEWDYGDGFTNSVGKHFYNNSGEYSVSVKITNTVIKQSFIIKYALPVKIIFDKKTIDFNPFDPIKEATTILYPNPVIDNINIKINNTGTAYKGTFRIFSYNGITVFLEKVLVQPGSNVFTFSNPLINHPAGAYIVKFNKGENDSDQFKLLKQ
jgi:hypothetical protein